MRRISYTMNRKGRTNNLSPQTPGDSAEDVTRIVLALDKVNTTLGIFERVYQTFFHRHHLCNDTRGRQFEKLL
ncbi:hypothetical protein TNCV_4790331 [Trichonephila clavipes]|nr:hypothetical protein TNCV_4790331 [Trichonephila clavipes]